MSYGPIVVPEMCGRDLDQPGKRSVSDTREKIFAWHPRGRRNAVKRSGVYCIPFYTVYLYPALTYLFPRTYFKC
jgi:hypothetical protein